MNISKELIDELNVAVSVEIGKEDYDSKVNEILRDYRRKANMPGFRPGKVPEGLVRKMYGKAVLIDEINKLVSNSLQDYIKEQELHLIGDPLPKMSGDEMDWEIGNDFTFEFEIGLAPKINISLSKEDQLTKHQIIVDQEMINKRTEFYTHRYGEYVSVDAVVDFNEKLTGDIVQLDADGLPLQDGLSAENSSFLLSVIKDDDRKKPFENAVTGNEIVFPLSETFSNDWEIASILKKKNKNEIGYIVGALFKFTVKSIEKYAISELNQQLFDKVYGEGEVTSPEDFENRVKEEIALDLEENVMIKFSNEVSNFLLEKFNPPMPEEFLRKWLITKNINEEDLEKEFSGFLKGMKWELISNAIVKQNELKVDEQEIIEFTKAAKRKQFMSYGITDFSDETLTNIAMESLKDEKSIREVASRLVFDKVVATVSELVTVNIQEISMEDFNHMMYASNKDETEEVTESEEKIEEAVVVEEAVVEVKEETKKNKQTKK